MGGLVEFEAAQHLEHRLPAGRALALVGGLRGAGRGDPIRREGLELDRVSLGAGRGVHEPQGVPGLPIVVDAGLGDDQAGPSWADLVPRC